MVGVPIRTLVVEDSRSMRELLAGILRERDHQVTELESAEQGLEAHLTEPFDLMLVDWTLPGMSGLELCQTVRARPNGEDVVILVITGRNKTEDLQEVLDAGASDYLAKPMDPDVLQTRLLIAERAVELAHRHAVERSDMESRLAFADRMASIGTLAAGVAHELNNPLMYVLSNLRLTREEIGAGVRPEDLERVCQQLDEATHGAVRMKHIVRDLKTFSRADDEQRGNVDVQTVLESSINMCWNELRHRATLEREFADVPLIDANESRLGQVFLNLLINALQAMPKRRASANRITVRTSTDDEGWAVIEVADNGRGIEPDRLARVFEPFFTTKGIAEGTGLGLSICRSIVHDAGGTIDVRSELGRGTEFVVRLPPSERVEVPATVAPPEASAFGARARVAVVDDEPLVGRSVRRALRGHEVIVLSGGAEAIERLSSNEPFDVVFCDLMMPEVSGIEVFEQVSKARPELSSRFVFMTGGAFTAEARAFLKETTLPCLEKPFELGAIRDIVRDSAERKAS